MALRTRRAVLGALAATVLAGVTGAISVRSQAAERVIPVRAYKFSYDPNELVVKLNEPVVLEFTTSDVVMGFNAPDFKLRADILPGETARLRFTPDKVGTFTFLCDIFCGDGHEGMSGTMKVVA